MTEICVYCKKPISCLHVGAGVDEQGKALYSCSLCYELRYPPKQAFFAKDMMAGAQLTVIQALEAALTADQVDSVIYQYNKIRKLEYDNRIRRYREAQTN